MKERIEKNEERLDKVILSVNNLENALTEFKKNKRNITLLNNYYGSKNWFKDKEAYEKGLIDVKAGVLAEDTVWNLLDDIENLILEMRKIIKNYKKNN